MGLTGKENWKIFIWFVLSIKATSDRVGLGITTVLTLSTISLDSRTDLPKVRYATALDWFLLMSFFYCIATLLEFAGVHYFTKVSSLFFTASSLFLSVYARQSVSWTETGWYLPTFTISVGSSEALCRYLYLLNHARQDIVYLFIEWFRSLLERHDSLKITTHQVNYLSASVMQILCLKKKT